MPARKISNRLSVNIALVEVFADLTIRRQPVTPELSNTKINRRESSFHNESARQP